MPVDIGFNTVREQTIRCKAGEKPQLFELPPPGEYQKIQFENCDIQAAKLLLKPPRQGVMGNTLWFWSPDENFHSRYEYDPNFGTYKYECAKYDVQGFAPAIKDSSNQGTLNLHDPKNFPNPSQKILSLQTRSGMQTFWITTVNDLEQPQPAQHGLYEIAFVEKLRGTKIPDHPRSYTLELPNFITPSDGKLVIKNGRGQKVLVRFTRSEDPKKNAQTGPILYIMSPQPFIAGKYFVTDPETMGRSFRYGYVYSAALDLRDKNDFDFDHPSISLIPNTNDQTFYITTLRAAGF